MTSFVTGATGFIGQRLLVGLEANGESVRILSRNPHPDYETVVCDLQFEVIPEAGLDGVDTVFHLAGFTHDLRDASKLEHLYRALNVDSTVRLTELAVRSGVKQFVFVSSVKAGGYNLEQDSPDGVYGQTKREAELKLLDIGRQSGMHVSIVRPSLVYGAGVKGNLALMRRGIEQGWFPPIPETENRRSMIHVDDLVRALLLAAEDKRANGEIYIATDGVPHSTREIYEAICYAVGKHVPNCSLPKFIFNLLAKLSPKLKYKVDKLLGDEEYSSEKLEQLGFQSEKNLMDFDA
jgi:nucleoside-diphosphate-sugar epimerase